MKYHLLCYLAGPAVWNACGLTREMDFLRVAFEGDNSRVCRRSLERRQP